MRWELGFALFWTGKMGFTHVLELGFNHLERDLNLNLSWWSTEADRSLPMHLCPGLHVAAKIAIFRCLRKIAKIERLALFWKLVAKIAKNRQLRFFAVLCHVNNHLSPEPVVMVVDLTKFAKNRKSGYFSRYLRFLAVVTLMFPFSCSWSPKSKAGGRFY